MEAVKLIPLFFFLSCYGSPSPSSAGPVTCKQLDNELYASCVCQMSDSKEFVNLAALKHNLTVPRFSTKGLDLEDKNWWFSYNPCTPFNMFENQHNVGYESCINVASARWTNDSAHRCNGLGNDTSAKFVYDTDRQNKFVVSNLTLSFTNETTSEEAVVSLVCNANITRNETIFKHMGTENTSRNIYYLSLEGECCCPGLCHDGIPTAGPSPTSAIVEEKKWIIFAAVGAILLPAAIATILYFFCRKRHAGYKNV